MPDILDSQEKPARIITSQLIGIKVATWSGGGFMKTQATTGKTPDPIEILDQKDGCELSLSADQQWMRLVVSGKQVASFHVNYVRKVLGTIEKKKIAKTESSKIKPETPANL
jgi:hypothetical protein